MTRPYPYPIMPPAGLTATESDTGTVTWRHTDGRPAAAARRRAAEHISAAVATAEQYCLPLRDIVRAGPAMPECLTAARS